MTVQKLVSSFLLSSVLFLGSCNFREDKTTDEPTGDTTSGGGTALSFADVKSQVIQPYCIRCHSAASGNLGNVNLETYATVTQNLEGVKTTVLVQHRMPPPSGLSTTVSSVLENWINQGAPEN